MSESAHRVTRRVREAAPGMRPFKLAFRDGGLEREFGVVYFHDHIGQARLATLLAVVVWLILGVLGQIELEDGAMVDAGLRLGVAVPIALGAFALTFTRLAARWWQQIIGAAVVLSSAVVAIDWALLDDELPFSWGFAGVMLALAFGYTFTRIRFVIATVAGLASVAFYDVVILTQGLRSTQFLYANLFLVSMMVTGMSVSYVLERQSRLLFVGRRDLAAEKERSEELLLNTLPAAIVERLKAGDDRIADACGDVSVLFADLVGFTTNTRGMLPADVVDELDLMFTRFDELAGRFGLEKIKTVGDAYMAVAGVPESRADHAEAAAEMALGILGVLEGARWPSGEPMRVRVGIASGPVVAGVIGRRKFAYDLWGDTVNLASRLESHGEPGRIQVSAATYGSLFDRYAFGERRTIDVKGIGPTPVWFLLGRR